MLSDYLSTVDWSRAQFAMTAIYHWLFVPLTLGLGFLVAIMETLYVRTKDPFWLRTTKFWMRLFGINFAIGVATGLILEFDFGTNWSNYSHFVGDIFGAPLAIEGILAFFLESTFIAVMFFGWRKVSRGFHLTASWLTAVGILRPEAQRTGGDAFYFRIDIPKMLSLMSFRSADAFVPGINDLVYGNEEYGVMPASEKIERGRVAVEELGRYRTAREKGDTAAITEIEAKFDRSTPQGAEFLREHFAYFGYGYLSSPEQIVPDVPLLFYSFRVMVGAGCFFILLLGLVWWLNRRDRLASKRWLLRTAVWSVPLAYLASQAGWVVAEVGRQPWAIQDLMPVGVAASKIPSGSVSVTFFLFLALFTALLAAELSIMFRQIKTGPKDD